MKSKSLKVLLIIEQCNPQGSSVPLVGYCFYEQISQLVDTTLVTHERNKPALEKKHPDRDITYISESEFIKGYYKIAQKLSKLGNRIIWPLYNTLIYPIYGEFNHLVYTSFKEPILRGDYDLVHAITPMIPRYPVKTIKACKNVSFVIGPVNGGVPFPKGFQDVARKEFAYLNFLRLIGRLIIPGYRETYEKADYILAGSTYTLNLLEDLFNIQNEKIELLYENGIGDSFLKEGKVFEAETRDDAKINLLFVGRLVPYKGADMLIEAVSRLAPSVQQKIFLTIVGDGEERNTLEQQVNKLDIQEKVAFAGWVKQQETLKYYNSSDIFCFPSIREFGGAVVLEAMATGLPCIVVNNGGIGEYVTEETGFSINPVSREFVVQELKRCIEQLVCNQALRHDMSLKAIQRAREFTWSSKAKAIASVYNKLLANCS
ncbi:glycosyltransferase family 4 protein [Brunnivagina elsteri]|uniref:Glycosyl transferase family 1 n=1 Tax=Brunnivagina elsteri CCALA 953 TaxID=987040 RepID=A0A2A2TC87_9CYAN|nr:glycosyltransferase family 4 protein [Calothrix elsteri]PAX51360.1 glycosyl transferase family 1 [Calothrix elsteri CCALA 953]